MQGSDRKYSKKALRESSSIVQEDCRAFVCISRKPSLKDATS
ncbi:hypothetical protein [Pseudomonas phage Eir4]|uniref:Uncharacterized protein n=1 Tax=Pseudomonas phage AH05 TaxID=2869574 RepID=A0AAE7X2B4_9CAUD|nr:hypothetical protein AH05_3 [Pseudomonas phage AH05]UGL61053.1 hypothetical protein [Pseudomonas phage Eir4]